MFDMLLQLVVEVHNTQALILTDDVRTLIISNLYDKLKKHIKQQLVYDGATN